MKCSQCGLIFIAREALLSQKDERSRYDLHLNRLDDERYADFLNRLKLPVMNEIKAGQEGLDFGCGSAPLLSNMLADEGYKMHHYDPHYFPDKALLEKHYDFVTCTEVVEHLHAPRREFELFKKLMKSPGGVLGIMTEMRDESRSFADWWYPSDPTHVTFYQIKTFEWIAQWMGWQLTHPRKNVIVYKV